MASEIGPARKQSLFQSYKTMTDNLKIDNLETFSTFTFKLDHSQQHEVSNDYGAPVDWLLCQTDRHALGSVHAHSPLKASICGQGNFGKTLDKKVPFYRCFFQGQTDREQKGGQYEPVIVLLQKKVNLKLGIRNILHEKNCNEVLNVRFDSSSYISKSFFQWNTGPFPEADTNAIVQKRYDLQGADDSVLLFLDH
jgi:hypothetical protein